jgi:hypothetical protein
VAVAAAAIGATAAIPIDPIKGEVRDPKTDGQSIFSLYNF